MFTIIRRYVLKEHLGPFAFGLGIIILVFLLNIVFREFGRIISRGLPFTVILEFFALNLAWIIALAVPMAVLIATLMAFGRLSGDGEVTAMKAGGVSVIYIIMPVLVASVFLAGFMIWFNNAVLPETNYQFKLLNQDIAQKRPTLALEPGVIYRDIENYSILVESIRETPDTSYVQNVYIEDSSDPNTSKYILAERGKIFLNRVSGMLYMLLYDGEMHELDLQEMEEYRRVEFPKQLLSIPVPEMLLRRSEQGYRGDREKSAAMMRAEIAENNTNIENRYGRMRMQINSYFEKHMSAEVVNPEKDVAASRYRNVEWDKSRLEADNSRLRHQLTAELERIASLRRLNSKLMVEVHKKYSIPVACIVFVLVGAPLGIMSRRGNMAMAGGVGFLFFLVYWVCLIGGEELADNQIISPFWAMWTANMLCGAFGVYLIFHSIREATFINWTGWQHKLKRLVSKEGQRP